MNKIMALAVEIAHETSEWTRSNHFGKAGRKYTDVPSYAALQAEVTRMEQEIQEAQTLKNLLFVCRQERDELRVKLAELEMAKAASEAKGKIAKQALDKLAALDNLLMVINERVGNGMIPWEIEDAFDEYEAAGAKEKP